MEAFETKADLYSPAFVQDPYPTYHQMIETAPVCWAVTPWGEQHYLVFRYADATEALKEAALSKEITRLTPADNLFPIDFSMLFRDPPAHTRLRGLVSQAFTPRRIKDLEPRITAIVEELLKALLAKREVEFMSEFAIPLPVMVIADLLGIPAEDQRRLHQFSNQAMVPIENITPEENDRRFREGYQGLIDYFEYLVKLRRAKPGDDLVSAMIQAGDGNTGDRLTPTELVGSCMLLLIAGHETTVNLLGNGLRTLFIHPEEMARLRARPELVPAAIEEMLRYESPVQNSTFRVTTRPYTVGGVTIPPEKILVVMIGAANRDPAQFPDPDRFDITREPNRHLGFGLGIHFCLGAPLARTEARIAFTCLLEHLPRLRLVEAQWTAGTFMRGLRRFDLQVSA
jgi:cytochrome P450